jgi:hypothetical protein
MADVKSNFPGPSLAARYRAKAAQARAKSRRLRRYDRRVNFLHVAALLDDLAWEAEQESGPTFKSTERQDQLPRPRPH